MKSSGGNVNGHHELSQISAYDVNGHQNFHKHLLMAVLETILEIL